jgi:hypothetical protein
MWIHEARAYSLETYDLDGLLAALFNFACVEMLECEFEPPVETLIRASGETDFRSVAAITPASWRNQLAYGSKLFLPFTAGLRGSNDDLPVAGRLTLSTWDVSDWLPAIDFFPPAQAATTIKAYYDHYGLLLRQAEGRIIITAAWFGHATGILPLADCAPLISCVMEDFVSSYITGASAE